MHKQSIYQHHTVSGVCTLVALCVALLPLDSANAQTMYKYVDKDGKVTYSDKPPKPGEKAEAVVASKEANTVKLDTKANTGKDQKFSDVKARGDARMTERDRLQKSVDDAEKELERAKKALENGRDPQPGEQIIIVRKQGGNSVQRSEAYYARIDRLEKAVKQAEEGLSRAQQGYRRGAPD